MAAPSPILIVDRGGIIAMANDAATNLFGYERQEFIGMSVDMLVPLDMRDSHKSYREGYLKHPSKRAMGANRDLYARHRTGRSIPVEVGLTPVERGKGSMIVASLVDLSERVAARRVLEEHANALEQSNRDLDDFAYAAAHDLRAPLRAIDQLASFIQEDAASSMCV